jgi:hypothetical protein
VSSRGRPVTSALPANLGRHFTPHFSRVRQLNPHVNMQVWSEYIRGVVQVSSRDFRTFFPCAAVEPARWMCRCGPIGQCQVAFASPCNPLCDRGVRCQVSSVSGHDIVHGRGTSELLRNTFQVLLVVPVRRSCDHYLLSVSPPLGVVACPQYFHVRKDHESLGCWIVHVTSRADGDQTYDVPMRSSM